MPTSDEVQRRLASRIREIAKKRGVPLAHLADRSGTSRSHLWNVLAGAKAPTLTWIVSIANALEVDVSELLARRG